MSHDWTGRYGGGPEAPAAAPRLSEPSECHQALAAARRSIRTGGRTKDWCHRCRRLRLRGHLRTSQRPLAGPALVPCSLSVQVQSGSMQDHAAISCRPPRRIRKPLCHPRDTCFSLHFVPTRRVYQTSGACVSARKTRHLRDGQALKSSSVASRNAAPAQGCPTYTQRCG